MDNLGKIENIQRQAASIAKESQKHSKKRKVITQISIICIAIVVIGAIVTFTAVAPSLFTKQKIPSVNTFIALKDANNRNQQVNFVSDANGVTIGKPDAKNHINYYFDLACPHCKEYHETTGDMFKEQIASGNLKITYHPIRFVADYSTISGAALGSVLQNDPSKFYDTVDAIYSIPAQTQFGWQYADYAKAFKDRNLAGAQAQDSIRSGDYAWWISENTRQARNHGVTGVPSLELNGKRINHLPQSKKT